MRVGRWIWMWVPLLCATHAAFADAVADYEAASKAYSRGDIVGSMPLYRRAAEAGHAAAQARIGYIMERSGFGADAAAWYRKAADQNDPDGQYGLGTLYISGEGVARDPVEARQWLTRAADQGHKQATGVIAEAYLHGGLGIDDAARKGPEAVAWLKRAADGGHLAAIDALAVAYGSGLYGLAPDASQAAAWAARARELRGVTETATKGGKGRR